MRRYLSILACSGLLSIGALYGAPAFAGSIPRVIPDIAPTVGSAWNGDLGGVQLVRGGMGGGHGGVGGGGHGGFMFRRGGGFHGMGGHGFHGMGFHNGFHGMRGFHNGFHGHRFDHVSHFRNDHFHRFHNDHFHRSNNDNVFFGDGGDVVVVTPPPP